MQILTERLRLREFVRGDWRAVLDYQRDPRYLRYYPWRDRTEEDARDFVRMFLDWQGERPRRRFQLAVTRRCDNRLIGNCGIHSAQANDDEAEIGYELDPDHWGLGYATEAAAAILEFAFRQLELQRITSWCIADNVASGRVLERLGFQMQRRSCAAEFFKGRWWNTLHYTLTGNSSDLLSRYHFRPIITASVSGTGQALSRNPENPRLTHGCLSAGYLDTGFRRYDGLGS